MRDIFTLALITSTIRLSTPLILAALGGMFSERSGVINIALEVKMLAGAFTAAAVTYAADTKLHMGNASPWVGLLAAILAGGFIAAIYAVACIRFKADQVVSVAVHLEYCTSIHLFNGTLLPVRLGPPCERRPPPDP
jgi:simple sugar transport system permease protein